MTETRRGPFRTPPKEEDRERPEAAVRARPAARGPSSRGRLRTEAAAPNYVTSLEHAS